MKNVSGSKMSKPRQPSGTAHTPRVGGHTTNRTPSQGVPAGKGV